MENSVRRQATKIETIYFAEKNGIDLQEYTDGNIPFGLTYNYAVVNIFDLTPEMEKYDTYKDGDKATWGDVIITSDMVQNNLNNVKIIVNDCGTLRFIQLHK